MLRRSSCRRRLWILVGGFAFFVAILGGTEIVRKAMTPPAPKKAADAFALDFIAFYTGGTFVAEGRNRDLFDLHAVQTYQKTLAAQHGVDLGTALGPWWNPPFYAWMFAPLSRLDFAAATAVWVLFNVLCVAASCWLMVRMLPAGVGWRTWLLIPAFVGISIPFIHTISHGQNAGMSLLIVSLAVTAWRAKRALLAGLIAGLMAYKPQHAVVLGGMLALSLGWRAVWGLAITGFGLLAVTLITLPGSLGDFLHQMPINVAYVQEQCVYLWERHATFKAFWRLLLQGREVGPPCEPVMLLTAISTATLALPLVRLTAFGRWLNPFDSVDRTSAEHRDRLIAATFLATPLLMPFYFDYDLLMLAVPFVLLAGLRIRTGRMIDGGAADRLVMILAPIAYAWMAINADVGEKLNVNLLVPLLALLAIATAWPAKKAQAIAIEVVAADEEAAAFSKAA